MAIAQLRISGMHCVSCSLNITRMLKFNDGIINASVNYADGMARIEYNPAVISLSRIESIIEETGYHIVKDTAAPDREYRQLRTDLLIASSCAVPLVAFAMAHMFGYLHDVFSDSSMAIGELILSLPIIYAGRNFYSRGFSAVVKMKTATMDTLIALGTGSAFGYSVLIAARMLAGAREITAHDLYFETAAMLISFVLLGKTLEARALGKTSDAVQALIRLQPKTAIVIDNDTERDVPVENIAIGSIIRVRPGDRIALDGTVISGTSYVDESLLTGESVPQPKSAGAAVIGGTINTSGSLTVRVERSAADTFLATIVAGVRELLATKAPIQNVADRVAGAFVPAVLGIAVIAALVWLMRYHTGPFALQVFISVLIIACPCSLGLAVPTAISVASGVAANRGILIKNASAVESLAKADTWIFDKTGTLTTGKPQVIACWSASQRPDTVLLSRIRAVEMHSEHPLAAAICAYAKEHGATTDAGEVTDFISHHGQGVHARIGADEILIGTVAWIESRKAEISAAAKETIAQFTAEGHTLVCVVSNQSLNMVFALRDEPKPDALSTVTFLHAKRKTVHMITGDTPESARAIAGAIGIDHHAGGLLPQDKAAYISGLAKNGHTVVMVGDGINDAIALAAADVAIALGSGTDIAIESADIVLVSSALAQVPAAYEISRRTMRTIYQNLFWACMYNALCIPLAAGVWYPLTGWLINPALAGAAMSLSSVSVVLNSLSLWRKDYKHPHYSKKSNIY